MAINRVTLIGRMTADAEVRDLPSGIKVARFTVAVNEFVKGEERANFFDVNAFGKTAEIIAQYAGKGAQIGIDGSLRQERWDAQDGQKRSRIVVVAQRIDLLSRKNSNEGAAPSSKGNYQSKAVDSGFHEDDFSAGAYDSLDDDLPF